MLRGLAEAHAGLAKVYSIGRIATGTREIWCIEVTNAATGSGVEKPGMYLDGNQHASEVMGGEVTLSLAHHPLRHHGRDPDVTRLLDTRVLSIVQRVDPDGAEAHMTGRVGWAYVHQGICAVTPELWTIEPFLDEVGWGAVPRDRPLIAIPGRYNRPDDGRQ